MKYLTILLIFLLISCASYSDKEIIMDIPAHTVKFVKMNGGVYIWDGTNHRIEVDYGYFNGSIDIPACVLGHEYIHLFNAHIGYPLFYDGHW